MFVVATNKLPGVFNLLGAFELTFPIEVVLPACKLWLPLAAELLTAGDA